MTRVQGMDEVGWERSCLLSTIDLTNRSRTDEVHVRYECANRVLLGVSIGLTNRETERGSPNDSRETRKGSGWLLISKVSGTKGF
jgi:hypothetical protein